MEEACARKDRKSHAVGQPEPDTDLRGKEPKDRSANRPRRAIRATGRAGSPRAWLKEVLQLLPEPLREAVPPPLRREPPGCVHDSPIAVLANRCSLSLSAAPQIESTSNPRRRGGSIRSLGLIGLGLLVVGTTRVKLRTRRPKDLRGPKMTGTEADKRPHDRRFGTGSSHTESRDQLLATPAAQRRHRPTAARGAPSHALASLRLGRVAERPGAQPLRGPHRAARSPVGTGWSGRAAPYRLSSAGFRAPLSEPGVHLSLCTGLSIDGRVSLAQGPSVITRERARRPEIKSAQQLASVLTRSRGSLPVRVRNRCPMVTPKDTGVF